MTNCESMFELDTKTGYNCYDKSGNHNICHLEFRFASFMVNIYCHQADGILSEKRYLTGDQLTTIDIGLYTTLIRFDKVYNALFWVSLRGSDILTDVDVWYNIRNV